MIKRLHSNLLIVGASALILGACTQGTGLTPTSNSMDAPAQAQSGGAGATQTPQKAFNRFPDIPVPSKANMDNSRTLIFGSGDTWYGQLSLDSGHSNNAMFDFYKQELTGFGWLEVTSVRAPVSVLTYERQGRVLSIQIEKASITGSRITLTVSPRGGSAPTMN